jgi:ATP-dependent Clp protease, protease subunit
VPRVRARLDIMGGIGPEGIYRSQYVVEEIEWIVAAGHDELVVHIDSHGGDLEEALEMAVALESCGLATVAQIEGFCGSAATLIALSCDVVYARPDAIFFIHEPTGGTRAERGLWRDAMLAFYVNKTGFPKARLEEMLKEEIHMPATLAASRGFIDGILEHGEPIPDADERMAG